MKKSPALAVLDFEDIPTGIYAVDAILKKAPIAFVRAGTVTHGRYLVVFGGSTGSTQESLNEAVAITGSAIGRAVEAALKGTPVELIEVRLSDTGLAGKGIALVAGSLPDIQSAADLAGARARVSYRLIPAPHDVLERDITAATRFEMAPF